VHLVAVKAVAVVCLIAVAVALQRLRLSRRQAPSLSGGVLLLFGFYMREHALSNRENAPGLGPGRCGCFPLTDSLTAGPANLRKNGAKPRPVQAAPDSASPCHRGTKSALYYPM
jgi:hypothetical protein